MKEEMDKLFDLFYNFVIIPIFNSVKNKKKITAMHAKTLKIRGVTIDVTNADAYFSVLGETYDGLKASYVGYWLLKLWKRKDINMIYGNFKELSDTLLKVNVPIDELMYIIFDIVKLNIYKGILDDNFKIGVHDKRTIINCISKEIKLPLILLLRQNAILKSLADFDYMKLKNAHRNIMIHYIDNPSREDISIVVNSLKELGIDDAICERINTHMNGVLSLKEQKVLREKEKEEKRSLIEKERIERESLPIAESKPLRTESDIRKTLNTYFDFQNSEAFTYLTLDEIIYCVCLLKGLEIKREEIGNFIRVQTEYNREFGENPIVRYRELRDKLLYYKSKGVLELIEIIKNIDEVLVLLDGLKTTLSSEDESFYSDYVSSELNKGEDLITYKREYESEVAAMRQKEVDTSDLKDKRQVL